LSRLELAKRLGVEPLNGTLQRVLTELRERGEWTIDEDSKPPLYRACFASNGEAQMLA
jgi:hypothetical protein